MIARPFWRRLLPFHDNRWPVWQAVAGRRWPRTGGGSVPTKTRFDDLEGGMWIDEALAAFVDGCNVPYETLWITDSWSRPLFERLRARILGPISDEVADALRRVVRKEHKLEDLIDWVERPDPKVPFAQFAKERSDARELAEAEAVRGFLAGQGDGREAARPLSLPFAHRWSLHASPHADLAPTMCPACALPGVKHAWKAAPRNQSGLTGGIIVICPCCQALLDVIARQA